MTPERLEEIRRHVADYRLDGDCSLLAYDSARVDRRALITEVDSLRADLDGVRADREALDAENQRLRHVLRCVERAPDGFDGAIIPEWLERMVSAALRGTP